MSPNSATPDNTTGIIGSIQTSVNDAIGFVQDKMAGDQRPEYQQKLSQKVEALERQAGKATEEGKQQASATVKDAKDFLSKEFKQEDKANDEAFAAELEEKVTKMSEKLTAEEKTMSEKLRDLTIGGLTNAEGMLNQAKGMLSGEEKNEEDKELADRAKDLTVGGIDNVKAGTESAKQYVAGDKDIQKDMQQQVDQIEKRIKQMSQEAKDSACETKANAAKKQEDLVQDAEIKIREAQVFLSGQFDKEKDSTVAKKINDKLIEMNSQLEEASARSSNKKEEEKNLGDRAREMTVSGIGVLENGLEGAKATLTGGAK